MDVRSRKVCQGKGRKNQSGSKTEGNLKESPGKKVEMVGACDEKR